MQPNQLRIKLQEGTIVGAKVVHEGTHVYLYYIGGDDEGFYTICPTELEAAKMAGDINQRNAENGGVLGYEELISMMGLN